METCSLKHRESFAISQEELFALLVTPSAIRSWWSAHRAVVVPGEDGVWAAAWGEEEDAPDYLSAARIREWDPPRRLTLSDYRYHAKSGPLPFDADLSVRFQVVPEGEGAALEVLQEGFPADPVADPFYEGCVQGWRDTFAGIRRHLAGGG